MKRRKMGPKGLRSTFQLRLRGKWIDSRTPYTKQGQWCGVRKWARTGLVQTIVLFPCHFSDLSPSSTSQPVHAISLTCPAVIGIHVLKCQPSVSQNATVFRDKIFKEVIKLK